MTRIYNEIRINASREQVWAILANLGAVARYNPYVKRSYYNTDIHEDVGAARICEFYQGMVVEERAVQWDPGSAYTLEIRPIRGMPMPVRNNQAVFNVLREGNDTLVTMTITYQPKFGLVGRLMDQMMVRKQFNRMMPNYLKGLKHYAETGEEVLDFNVLKRVA